MIIDTHVFYVSFTLFLSNLFLLFFLTSHALYRESHTTDIIDLLPVSSLPIYHLLRLQMIMWLWFASYRWKTNVDSKLNIQQRKTWPPFSLVPQMLVLPINEFKSEYKSAYIHIYTWVIKIVVQFDIVLIHDKMNSLFNSVKVACHHLIAVRGLNECFFHG